MINNTENNKFVFCPGCGHAVDAYNYDKAENTRFFCPTCYSYVRKKEKTYYEKQNYIVTESVMQNGLPCYVTPKGTVSMVLPGSDKRTGIYEYSISTMVWLPLRIAMCGMEQYPDDIIDEVFCILETLSYLAENDCDIFFKELHTELAEGNYYSATGFKERFEDMIEAAYLDDSKEDIKLKKKFKETYDAAFKEYLEHD